MSHERVTTVNSSLVTCHSSLSCPHAHALHGLEEFALGLNRRRDDDFRLLKFSDVARAHISHAGRDCADEILAAIIDFGGTKEDLFEGTGGADFDARAA